MEKYLRNEEFRDKIVKSSSFVALILHLSV